MDADSDFMFAEPPPALASLPEAAHLAAALAQAGLPSGRILLDALLAVSIETHQFDLAALIAFEIGDERLSCTLWGKSGEQAVDRGELMIAITLFSLAGERDKRRALEREVGLQMLASGDLDTARLLLKRAGVIESWDDL